MRILVVTQYFWPENFRINDLVAELTSLDHQVTILTGYPNYPSGVIFPSFKSDPSAFLKFNGANVVRVPLITRGKGGGRLILNYLSYVASAIFFGTWYLRGHKFDLIFVFEPSPITVGLPAILLRYLKRAPIAFWVLDLWPETLSAIGVVRSKWLLKSLGYLVSFIYNHCDLILAQSKSFIPKIRQYCNKDTKVEYFPSWSDAAIDFSMRAPAAEISNSHDKFNIMFAGNIGEAQDFPAILRTAEILHEYKKFQWLILGDGRLTEWLESEISKRGLDDCVLLLGRYPIERMPSFFLHADALLVSLKNEPIFSYTIPGKLQSYLASGIPVLAMLNGEGAEIIQESGAGIVCQAGDSAGLASAIIKIANLSNKQRSIMGSHGQAFADKEFNRKQLISNLIEMFEELHLVNSKS